MVAAAHLTAGQAAITVAIIVFGLALLAGAILLANLLIIDWLDRRLQRRALASVEAERVARENARPHPAPVMLLNGASVVPIRPGGMAPPKDAA